MRKVTTQAVQAFQSAQNFSSSNTSVVVQMDNKKSQWVQLFLHGHLIAERKNKDLYICDCGYQSNTTKERLNGLLSEVLSNSFIQQKDWTWYLTTEEKTRPMESGKRYKIKGAFFSGMTQPSQW